MLPEIKILLVPHEHNNYKSKVLHLSSLSFFIVLVIFFQLFITLFHQVKPGVLGFAANINPDTVVSLTNDQRNRDGLSSLTIDPRLNEAAREKAADMFAKDYWAHYAPDGTTPWWFFKNVGYSYTFAGENLARDFGDSGAVLQAWMNSPSHKENLMNPKFENIGVAVVDGLLNGEETTLVVQMFGTTSQQTAVLTQEPAGNQFKTALAANNEAIYVPQINVSETSPGIFSPLISSFSLTKAVNLSVLILLIAVLLLDAFWIFRNRIIRLSGRSIVHFSFLLAILAIVILTKGGQIL